MLASSQVVATIPVVDLERAVRFYNDTLGLQILRSDEGSALLEAGQGSKIFMYQREATKAEHTAATFYLDNLDEVVDGLIERGVVFEQYDFGELKTDQRGVIQTPDGNAAWIKDPEGNILALTTM